MPEDPRRIIIIRHSLPFIDPGVPARQRELSKPGRARCITLAERLAFYHPDSISSSYEPKAKPLRLNPRLDVDLITG